MAFSAITTAQIAVGEPTAKDLFQKSKDNFDDHESRITTLELSAQSFRPITFEFVGQSLIGDNQLVERINFGMTILSARIFLIDSGSSGTLTIDIEKSTNGGGSWASIFSTLPSIASGAGDYSLSTNQVFSISPTEFDAGDLMRTNVDSIVTGSNLWQAIVEFEVT